MFFGEDEVTEQIGRDWQLNSKIYLKTDAVIWTQENRIEYILYRNGKAVRKTIPIHLDGEKQYLKDIFPTGDEGSLVLLYNFEQHAQLVIWDLVANQEITNLSP